MENELKVIESSNQLQPANMGELMQMSDMLSRTEFVPAAFQGKPNDIVAAILTGKEIGLSAMQSLRNIAVINGRASIWGDAMTALVQSSPIYGGMNESFNDETMTASCTVWRKGGEKRTQSFSQEDATIARLWAKKGPWTQYPKRMLQMRARGFALRDQFADCLAGLVTAEEARDTPKPVVEVVNELSVTEQIEECQTIQELMDIYKYCTAGEKEDFKDYFTEKKEVLNNG